MLLALVRLSAWWRGLRAGGQCACTRPLQELEGLLIMGVCKRMHKLAAGEGGGALADAAL